MLPQNVLATLRRLIMDIKQISEERYSEMQESIRNELREIPKCSKKILYLTCVRDGLQEEIKQSAKEDGEVQNNEKGGPSQASKVLPSQSQSDSAISQKKKTQSGKRKRTSPDCNDNVPHKKPRNVLITTIFSGSNSSTHSKEDTCFRGRRTCGEIYRRCRSCTF
uniref:Uncharacterized protein n=1 Tax=Photinus pyralis TaxID=7054 RepID=A0A1Y1MWP8_PHOPY